MKSKIIVLNLLVASVLLSCIGEVKEKFKTAKEGISNVTTIVKEAEKVEERIDKLKEATPLTNAQLKEWLPKNLENFDRTGFKVGQAGMYQVNSVEGTYKQAEHKKVFKVMVVDGAGPTGSVMAVGFGMVGTMDMESEDEYKHQQTVTVNGIQAQQVYKKKRNDTELIFIVGERFLVTVNTTDIDVAATWALVNQLELEELVEMIE